jgi:hypothetical protein
MHPAITERPEGRRALTAVQAATLTSRPLVGVAYLGEKAGHAGMRDSDPPAYLAHGHALCAKVANEGLHLRIDPPHGGDANRELRRLAALHAPFFAQRRNPYPRYPHEHVAVCQAVTPLDLWRKLGSVLLAASAYTKGRIPTGRRSGGALPGDLAEGMRASRMPSDPNRGLSATAGTMDEWQTFPATHRRTSNTSCAMRSAGVAQCVTLGRTIAAALS